MNISTFTKMVMMHYEKKIPFVTSFDKNPITRNQKKKNEKKKRERNPE